MLEAQASGLCCLASNVGGNPTLIQDWHNGFLFNNFTWLKSKMILAPPLEGYIRKRARNAQETIQQHDNSIIIKRLEKCLNT